METANLSKKTKNKSQKAATSSAKAPKKNSAKSAKTGKSKSEKNLAENIVLDTSDDGLAKITENEIKLQPRSKKNVEELEKENYDLKQVLEISRSLSTTLEYAKLIESVIYVAMAQMRVAGAGIVIHEGIDSDVFTLGSYFFGMTKDPSYDYKISINSQFIAFFQNLKNSDHTYTPEELKKCLGENKDLDMLLSLKPTLIVPMIVKNRLSGFLLLGEKILTDEGNSFSDYERYEIYTIASLAAIAVNNTVLIENSSTDSMTHLKLKYYFFNVLSDRLDLAFAQKETVSVIMFDIDFFKKFNDTYGHACGDYVLSTVAKIMKDSIREDDLASRYGGEEFTVMLYNASKKDSLQIADRIRKNIEKYDFFYKDQHMKVTISGGLSMFSVDNNPVTSAKVLVDQADQALYVSKKNGRNRITFAEPATMAALR